MRLATLPMPRGQGHAPMPVPVAPWRRYCTRSCGRGRRKYPQAAAAASRQLRVASCKNGQKQVPRPKRRRAYRQRFIVYVIGVRTYSHWLERISPLIIDQAVMTILFQLTIYYLGALLVSRHRILANIAFLFAKRGETWSGDTWSQRTPVHARRAADFRLHKAHARACRRTHAGSPTSACTGHGLAHQLRGPRRPCLVVPSSRNRQASGR